MAMVSFANDLQYTGEIAKLRRPWPTPAATNDRQVSNISVRRQGNAGWSNSRPTRFANVSVMDPFEARQNVGGHKAQLFAQVI